MSLTFIEQFHILFLTYINKNVESDKYIIYHVAERNLSC